MRRCFSIRGHPALMKSDNGTQMVGAERELREMIEGWDVDELKFGSLLRPQLRIRMAVLSLSSRRAKRH